MRLIDLSIALESDLPSDPPIQIPKIQYQNHKESAQEMAAFFEGATVADLPDGNGWANDFLTLSTHSGTHLDAPWHFFPTMNGGEPSWTIDQIPLEWCIGKGVVIDFRDKPDGYKIMAKDLEGYFKGMGYTLQPGDIVLLMTGADKRWGTKEYLLAGCGMSREATLWLVRQGIHVVGTDGWSWDVPLPIIGKEFHKTRNPDIIWEAHRVGREAAYCHIEKLTNLDRLPLTGFQVFCFPIKVKGGSAGWVRAVAMLED